MSDWKRVKHGDVTEYVNLELGVIVVRMHPDRPHLGGWSVFRLDPGEPVDPAGFYNTDGESAIADAHHLATAKALAERHAA